MKIEWRETEPLDQWVLIVDGMIRAVAQQGDDGRWVAQTVYAIPALAPRHEVHFTFIDLADAKADLEALVTLEYWRDNEALFDVILPDDGTWWIVEALFFQIEGEDGEAKDEAYQRAVDWGNWLKTRWKGKAS
jgi:hypothetical protein